MSKEFAGRRVLVVEDKKFLAANIEYELLLAGAEVIGPLAGVAETLDQVRADGFDLAVLGINLGGRHGIRDRG